ncbi:MAG TPA: hypothetical protein VJS20_03395 [Gemmatimonadales bacterium]|nr:hypothetical protein [Gemmatimonadales bacterium]
MTFTMFRKCMTFAMTAVALAPVPSAEAGPESSPFAGTYDWGSWAVTISDKGQISGVLVRSSGYTDGSISGRVAADGSYSFTMSVTFRTFDDSERRTHGPEFRTVHYKFQGILALDAGGNAVGTPDSGGSFTWLRQ